MSHTRATAGIAVNTKRRRSSSWRSFFFSSYIDSSLALLLYMHICIYSMCIRKKGSHFHVIFLFFYFYLIDEYYNNDSLNTGTCIQ